MLFLCDKIEAGEYMKYKEPKYKISNSAKRMSNVPRQTEKWITYLLLDEEE